MLKEDRLRRWGGFAVGVAATGVIFVGLFVFAMALTGVFSE